MQPVDAHAFAYIEEQFFEWGFVFVFEILREFLGLENKFLLDKINQHCKHNVPRDDIDISRH
jgi:hypothetical protein